MENLAAWLRRLPSMKDPKNVRRMTLRMFVPGHSMMNFDNWLFTTEQPTPVPAGFRAGFPESVALLAYLEASEYADNARHNCRLAIDIATAMSLALERRIDLPFELVLTVPGSKTVTFMPYSAIVDRIITAPLPPDPKSLIVRVLEQLGGLEDKDISIIGAAASMFHGALLLHDRDIRAAYTLLIAGIETLSREYGHPPTDWSDWENSTEWDAFAADISLSADQSTALRNRLMANQQLRLRATFRSYAATRLSPSFWDRAWNEHMYELQVPQGSWGQGGQLYSGKVRDFLTSERTELSRGLARSYDMRSSYVHSGEWSDPFDLTLDPRAPVEMRRPLPFAIMRAILRELIVTEMAARAQPYTVPDVQLRRVWQSLPG